MGDNIKAPSHYVDGRKYEPKDVIRDWGLNFNLGSAIKYISRAGRKGDKLEDLKKAKQFLQFEIEATSEEDDLKCIVRKIDNDILDCFDISSDLYRGYQDIRDAIARQALRHVGDDQKSDIGMTCKEAAAIGDAMAKGFEAGIKEAEENHNESEENSYIETEIVKERMTFAYVYGLLSRVIGFNSIPDEYKRIVIDKIAQKVLDNQCNITLDIPTKELQDMVISRIVDRINNDELNCFDIPGNLYSGYHEIRDALIIQVLRNAGNDTFISETYVHHVIKGIIPFDSIPDEYKSGVIDRIVEMIDNGTGNTV